MRRVGNEELERRLREEAPGEVGMSARSRASLARRLDEAGTTSERRAAPRWALPAAGMALAAALTVAAILAWPRGPRSAPAPEPRSPGAPEVARALGEAIRDSVDERPRALVLALERTDDPLAAEAERLLADARSLAERLTAPVRTMRPPAP